MQATSVFKNEPAQLIGTEQSTCSHPRRRKQIVNHLAKIVRQPMVYRCSKACFGLREDFLGQNVAHRFTQNVFPCRAQKSLQLEARRYAPRSKFGQLAVEKWHSHLN